ncbi:hypothetical protein AV530_017713 [Patagioenas fasciata monilis]|uniref:CYRIA/CYRIB Rac1 binding domain-containing protein n=1 Tax=Patagioenas fasciata monilis TaxID=372326 RepID=A0A1V4KVB5_PATFA|nr:hypothetical protein AV530_017713 [Patagioenas fasciata monilis]
MGDCKKILPTDWKPKTECSTGCRYLNMGNLLKVLTCTDLEQGPNFFLDFENAQPTESEKEIYNQVNVVLKDAEGILEDLQSYRGAGHEIREMKGCIKVLKDQPPNSVEGLLNALRYTTKHLNDETTSKQIKSMLQ